MAEPTRSPLWLVAEEPLIEELVLALDTSRRRIMDEPNADHTLLFSRHTLEATRQSFGAMIRRGEAKLHALCEILAARFVGDQFDLDSLVIGELQTTRERFTMTQRIATADLYSHTDLDLGSRMLQRIRMHDGTALQQPQLVANVVEYQPRAMGRFAVHKLVSRIKAEEEIWNKVVDEIFGLDQLVNRDKQLRELSRFVKDVFGVKFVVDEGADVTRLQQALADLRLDEAELGRHGVPVRDTTKQLDLVEVKNYLGDDEKKSGWGAMKSVASWWDKLFEIQIITLGTHQNEREILTRESHGGFKTRRESVRDAVAEQVPLFKFYRDLLQWLFLGHAKEAAPTFPRVSIVVDA
ncbi:MAG: hypothetical protein H7Z43_07360 [Clostridia bacterium]|nr:hypothetical protein [Deltaproteobacteria bacterium]